MRKAWLWAKQNKSIDEKLIIGIAERIDPEVVLGYRHDQIRIQGSYLLPPRPEKVPGEMEKLTQQTEGIPTLEKALCMHFEIVRIHPFPDANGRTARIVQNLILAKEDLPPIIIYEGEREHYRELLQEAILGHYDRQGIGKHSNEERTFYNFLATRVNINLDRIIDHIEEKNKH